MNYHFEPPKKESQPLPIANEPTREDLELRVSLLLNAIDYIANPLAHLQARAAKTGMVLNGNIGVSLSKDPAFLQGIAQEALDEYNHLAGTELKPGELPY